MTNLYTILGVKEDASRKDLKQAYRRLAMKHHPDRKTGDGEMFNKIKLAYEVLSDDARRKRYDETGDYGQQAEESVESLAVKKLNEAFIAVMESCDPVHDNIIHMMKHSITKVLNVGELKKMHEISKIEKIHEMRERLDVEDDSALLDIMEGNLKHSKRSIDDIERHLQILASAIELLDGATYDYEKKSEEARMRDDPFNDIRAAMGSRGPFKFYTGTDT